MNIELDARARLSRPLELRRVLKWRSHCTSCSRAHGLIEAPAGCARVHRDGEKARSIGRTACQCLPAGWSGHSVPLNAQQLVREALDAQAYAHGKLFRQEEAGRIIRGCELECADVRGRAHEAGMPRTALIVEREILHVY